MLEVRDVHKSFGSLEVLKGVGLRVSQGDVVAILGPSGSGKTTLLRCINFLETAGSGTMIFDGETFQMERMSRRDVARLRKKTAFVFQNYNLFRNKTALQNVTEGLITARKMPKDQAEDEAMKALRKVGMADRATDPEIIYFDEPTSALDPELTGEVLSVMRNLAEEGRTMLVVTHEMGFARNVSTHVVFMEDGAVVEEGPSREVFRDPRQARTREFLRTTGDAGV